MKENDLVNNRDDFDFARFGSTGVLRLLRLSAKIQMAISHLLQGFLFRGDTWKELPQVHFLMMSPDANKVTTYRGKNFDRYLDSLSEELRIRGYKTAHLARPPASIFGATTFSDAHSINLAYLLARLFDAFSGKRGEVDEGSHVFQLFRRMLIRVKPKALFTAGYLHPLKAAAESLGIPLIEVLHSRGYVDDPRIWLTSGSPQLPTGVFSFDSISSTNLRQSFRKAGVEIFDIEDFAYNFFVHNSSLVDSESKLSDFEVYVLVTLSWGFAGEDKSRSNILSDGLLPNGLLEAVRLTRLTHSWKVRMHPVQVISPLKLYRRQKKYLERLAKNYPNFSLDLGEERSIYEALTQSSHHITTMSQSVYEASQVGIPSLVLCKGIPSHSRYFNDLESEGWLEKGIDDHQVILDWISRTRPRADGGRWKSKFSASDIDSFLVHPLVNRDSQEG